MANPPVPPKNALYTLGSRDVRDETLKFVEELLLMKQRGYSVASLGRALETHVLKCLNAERKELSAFARELDVTPEHIEIRAAASRMGASQTATVAIDVCRQLFARLCVERISGG